MSLIVTLSPMIRPVTALVIVTVVPVSDAAVIGLATPGHIAGSAPAQIVPAAHPGTDAIAVKASVVGLYNSAVLSAICPVGDPAGGGDAADRNELPVEPPTISTWPSSEVPLPSISV